MLRVVGSSRGFGGLGEGGRKAMGWLGVEDYCTSQPDKKSDGGCGKNLWVSRGSGK